jgi:hypothetical protein
MTKWLTSCCGLPLDIYLVDDLEESARLASQPMAARLARWLEPRVLKQASRVFTISPGYAEHLAAKYGVHAEWLPVSVTTRHIEHRPYQPKQPDVRPIVFIGAVNDLYVGAIRDLLQIIEEWNVAPHQFALRLVLLTYTTQEYIRAELGDSKWIEATFVSTPEELHRRLQESWAIFIPYSFSAAVKVLVSTSFPTKLVDCLPAGRPVVVYGPSYASVPRYFKEHRLQVCCNSAQELKTRLKNLVQYDTKEVILEYEMVLDRFHSPEHLRAILGGAGGAASRRQGDG